MELYNSCGIGFVFQFSKNITVNKVSIVPNAKRGRKIVSAHDDAMQFSNCSGLIRITGCRFRGMFDDALNVHGTSAVVKEISGRKITGEFVEQCSKGFKSFAKAGDIILFSERATLNARAECIVKAYRLINNTEFEIEFDSNIPEGVKEQDAIENLSNTPELIFEDNFVGSARARGILVTTPGKVVIRNNVFDTSGSAILISGDSNGWFESGACKDMMISDNYFTSHCLTSDYQFCEGIISIFPVIQEPLRSKGYHENITVTRNCFEIAEQKVLYAACVNNLSFTDNTIIQSKRYIEGIDPFAVLEHCCGIKVSRNKFFGFNITRTKNLKIAFLGDSITEGCFELVKQDNEIVIVRDQQNSYPAVLKNKLQLIPGLSVEIINAGISGNTTKDGLQRLERDVLDKGPDLLILCFGLNDVTAFTPEQYAENLYEIIKRLKKENIPVVYMTPNVLNTYIHKNTLPELIETAENCCKKQNDGTMDELISRGKACALENGCVICDCYEAWKKLALQGYDTTELLCNYINHPTRQMHNLFADMLFEVIYNNFYKEGYL